MSTLERILFTMYRLLRVGSIVQCFSRPHLVCLGYHDVGKDEGLSVSLSTLERQIRAIKKLGYTFVTLGDARSAVRGEGQLPRKSAMIYFDDGRNGVTDARDLFLSHGIRPVFFITPAWLNQEGFLKESDTQELEWADIGAHGFSHERFARLGKEEAMTLMERSRNAITQLVGKEVHAWSYPHSDPDAHAPESAFASGYDVVIGAGRGRNMFPLSGFLKKIPMTHTDTLGSLRAKLGGFFDMLAALRRIKKSLLPLPKHASMRVWRAQGIFRRVRIVLNDALFLQMRLKGGWSSLILISHTKLAPFPRMRVREKCTLLVDIAKDDESLLASFSDTCRNEIRRTFRDEQLSFVVGAEDMREVMKLYRAFRAKKHLPKHGASYFAGSLIFRAYDGKKLVAVVTAYGGECARVQHIFSREASSKEERNRIAYATRRLLFECMKYARDAGSRDLDLAGINTTRSEKAGITAFKRSFGGREIPEFTYTIRSPFLRLFRGA